MFNLQGLGPSVDALTSIKWMPPARRAKTRPTPLSICFRYTLCLQQNLTVLPLSRLRLLFYSVVLFQFLMTTTN